LFLVFLRHTIELVMKCPFPSRYLAWPALLVLGFMLAMAGSGWANSIHQYDRIYDTGAGQVQLNTDFVNTDSGAVYESYETGLFSDLVDSVWENTANQTRYGSKDNMLSDWSLYISPGGDVNNGWSIGSDFENVELTHGPGWPVVDYDNWTDAAASDMMRLTLNIPLSQLDGDGDGWAVDDPMDYQIVFGNSVSNCGVGHHGINSFYASAEPYEVELNPQTTSNGTSILWLESYGYTNNYETASTNNPDSDSYPTGQEYTLDTNPTNATPDFKMTFPGGSNPAVMTFSPSSTGRTYTVFKTVGLTNPVWIAGATCTGGVGSTTITNTLVLGPQYIQIRVNRPE